MRLATKLGLLLAVSVAAGCSEQSPAAPAAVPDAGGDGSRTAESGSQPQLKLTAPTPTEPANGHTYPKGERPKALEAEAATGEFAEIKGVVHRFQVLRGDRRVVDRVVPARGETAVLELGGASLAARTTYQWRVRGENEEGVGPWSATATFTTGGGVQPRTPDGQTSEAKARAQLAAVGGQLVAAQPDLLYNHSCQEHTPTGWRFLDTLVDRLRQDDNRWGFNGKRGNPSDPSKDVVAYHHGPGRSENSRDVWIYDVIIGHCGSPSYGVNEVHSITPAGMYIWITRGRFKNEY